MTPGKVIIAGDWHGNSRWAASVVRATPKLLDGEPARIILQLGDFGYWPRSGTGADYLNELEAACREHDVNIWWIDGNHEDHESLKQHDPSRWPHLRYLQRGTRWEWHNRTWLALGGAVSVDKTARREGVSWFPEEAITASQAVSVAAEGHADVMLTHDCPAGISLPLNPLPEAWKSQEQPVREHRELLQQIAGEVKPSYLFHGHYHMAYSTQGEFRSTGLDMDGEQASWLICDTRTMAVSQEITS
jgi:hypothetical protein